MILYFCIKLHLDLFFFLGDGGHGVGRNKEEKAEGEIYVGFYRLRRS